MFCYSSNTFCAHNHFPHKLVFHPEITYIGDIVSYRYILYLFIASVIDITDIEQYDIFSKSMNFFA